MGNIHFDGRHAKGLALIAPTLAPAAGDEADGLAAHGEEIAHRGFHGPSARGGDGHDRLGGDENFAEIFCYFLHHSPKLCRTVEGDRASQFEQSIFRRGGGAGA